jgi:hypothetical protein
MPGLVVIHGSPGERGTRKTPNVSTTLSLVLLNRKNQLQERRANMDMYGRQRRSQNE